MVAYFTSDFTGQSISDSDGITIPDGVSDGDLMLMYVNAVTDTDPTGLDFSINSTGTSWTKPPGSTFISTATASGFWAIAGFFYCESASASDSGKFVTVSSTVNVYWSLTIAVYTDAEIDAFLGAAFTNQSSITCPSVDTTSDDDWAVYFGGVTDAFGDVTAPSGTLRLNNESPQNVAGILVDSNGSVGPSGTSIGGGAFHDTSDSTQWVSAFTVALKTPTSGTPVSITGVAASLTLDGGVGSVTATDSVNITGVAAALTLAGGVGSVDLGTSVHITGVAASITIAGGKGYGFVQVFSPSTTAGVTTYSTFSEINNTADSGNQDMRVLPPSSPNAGYDHAFLWMLPVEPGQGTTFGDSIATAKALNIHNDFNLTCIQPGFPLDPWYGNNINDPQTQQETFMIQLTRWAEKVLGTTGEEKHYLIGFSKSGFGGQVLFLRNQSVFSGVISWDAACDYQTLDQYDGGDVFGDQDQLDTYALYDPNLATWKALGDTGTINRIQLAAGINLVDATSDYADRLTSDGILNTYTFVETDSHNWAPDPGWVEPTILALLGGLPVSITGVAAEIVLDGGIGTATVTNSVNVTGVGATLTIAGGVGSIISTKSVNVQGVAAQLILDGGVGSIQNGINIHGTTGTLIIAGGVGSVTVHTSVNISGHAASLVLSGGTGSVHLGNSVAEESSLFVFSQL